MRGLVIVGVLALILGGCLQRTEQRAATADRCDVTVSAPWAPAEGAAPLTIEAGSMGPNCAQAVATIAVRDGAGILYTQVYPTAQVMMLAPARDNNAMRAALAEWTDSSNHTFATSSALPDWPEGSNNPVSGEFPFYATESLGRADYLALRQRDVPVYCYVQGMESQNCLALENGIMTEIGVQTFPG